VNGISLCRQSDLDKQVDIEVRVATILANGTECNCFVGLEHVLCR
jgi:hypothetical protein